MVAETNVVQRWIDCLGSVLFLLLWHLWCVIGCIILETDLHIADWSPLGPETNFQLAVFGSGTLNVWDQNMEHSYIEMSVPRTSRFFMLTDPACRDVAQASFYTPEPDYVIIFNSHITLGTKE